MSLLNKVANREVFDFLRTLTIKSNYFAEKSRESQIVREFEDRTPETAVPYIIHLAGEYIFNNEDYELFPQQMMVEGEPWFKGYRKTKDDHVVPFKNYWRNFGDALSRVSAQDLEYLIDPSAEGLYEIQPYTVKGVTNPITGKKETYEIRSSQLIYGAGNKFNSGSVDRLSGYLNYEVKNSDIFVDCFDEPMFVHSLDTGEEIPFCLEAFYADAAIAAGLSSNSIHTKTLEAYRIPGRYFDILCQRYPKQVDLIKAIVYRVPDEVLLRLKQLSSLITEPELKKHLEQTMRIGLPTDSQTYSAYLKDLARRYPKQAPLLKLMGSDIDGSRSGTDEKTFPLWERRRTRIAKAQNFTLLAYDDERLDSTERVNMREYVCQTLDVFRNRWAVNEYNFEKNYATVLWSCLWSVLPLALVARRYANIKTPAVSISHMWDYLNSKGLASYKGYLSDKQTWFLYKNIQFLFQHQGQQKALDILVDNILSDYGLTLKSKTVVLDTTNSLKRDQKPQIAKGQCLTCSRRNVSCFRNDNEHLCDEWLGTKHLCKAEPVVLTEEFIGATKKHIIRLLIKNYGYTEDAAEVKYRRSFIWKDEEVEKIRDDLNRDQMVDMTGHIDTLEQTLEIEHSGGQEPVINSDILEQQTKELQHMNGTYAPTKLLEMHQQTYNVKFTELFNRFITESFLRLATKTDDGLKRVNCSYHFTTAEGAANYIFDFGEMLATCYLGIVREYMIDSVIDRIAVDDSGKPLYEFVLDEDGNKIEIDKKPDGTPIYLKKLASWTRKYFTDLENRPTYNFAIPDKCKTTTTFRFGKPVLQEELVVAWNKDVEENFCPNDHQSELLDLVKDGDNDTRIISIRDVDYAVTFGDEPSENEEDIWETFSLRLKILGSFTHELVGDKTVYHYHPNNDEIPLIPKFFRWYYTHLNPLMSATEEEKKEMAEPIRTAMKPIFVSGNLVKYVEAECPSDPELDVGGGFQIKKNPGPNDPAPQEDRLYYDRSRGSTYRLFTMKSFLNLDDILNKWVDVTDVITDQNKIASYIDNMFEILESIYSFASASGSVRTHTACSKFLDYVITQKEIRFDLTGTERNHDNAEGGKSAWFSDWLAQDEELLGAFNIVDHLKDASVGWNEISTSIINKLLEGCTIQYAKESINRTQYQKLKELVLSLSSYRITVVDNVETGQVVNSTVSMVEDALIDIINTEEKIYFDPIGDSGCAPHVGGYKESEDEDGNIFVQSYDLRYDKTKTYYNLFLKDSDAYEHQDKHQSIHLRERPLGHPEKGLPEGTILDVGCEEIDVPAYEKFQPYLQTSDRFILRDKNDFKRNPISRLYVPASVEDYITKKVADVKEEIPEEALRGSDAEGNEIVYIPNATYEEVEDGAKLPFSVILFEKVSIYSVLGIPKGTPLLIAKLGTKWYYRIGTEVEKIVQCPASEADINDPRFDKGDPTKWYEKGDTFDLKNDFSNVTNKKFFDSVVYRLNVPVKDIEWSEDIHESPELGKALYPTIVKEAVVTESHELYANFVETSIVEQEKENS